MRRPLTSRRAFTLMEVLVAVVIVGLVITAGFRLITMSLRTLSDVRIERELNSAAERILLNFKLKKDMADKGEEDGIKWEARVDSVPLIGDLELTFRRLTVTIGDRSMILYLPENN